MLSNFFLYKCVWVFRLKTSEGFNKQFASALNIDYFSFCSYGRGGFDEDLSEGADSISSSSVADL